MLITRKRIREDVYSDDSDATRKALEQYDGKGINTATNAGKEQMRLVIQSLRNKKEAEAAQRVSGVAVR